MSVKLKFQLKQESDSLFILLNGNTVKWYYKSSGYPRDYQMRTYAPGSSEEYPADVIANVWNYDSR